MEISKLRVNYSRDKKRKAYRFYFLFNMIHPFYDSHNAALTSDLLLHMGQKNVDRVLK